MNIPPHTHKKQNKDDLAGNNFEIQNVIAYSTQYRTGSLPLYNLYPTPTVYTIPLYDPADRQTLTRGSLSPPTSILTAPSFRASVRTVLLSLSATYRQLQGSSGAGARPDGWAKPALCG